MIDWFFAGDFEKELIRGHSAFHEEGFRRRAGSSIREGVCFAKEEQRRQLRFGLQPQRAGAAETSVGSHRATGRTQTSVVQC